METNWTEIERAWCQVLEAHIIATADAHPDEVLYAGAFWLLYGDYSSILAPMFSLNAESYAKDVRWHPPDWRWHLAAPAVDQITQLYRSLSNLALSRPAFERLWERHIETLARASRYVTATFRRDHVGVRACSLAGNFFVGILDFSRGDEGIEYVRRSVDEETIASTGVLEDA